MPGVAGAPSVFSAYSKGLTQVVCVHELQVVLIDHSQDSNLCALEERAAEAAAAVSKQGTPARIKVRSSQEQQP